MLGINNLRSCRLGDLFSRRTEKGKPGLPTLSVTLNDGLVNREDLDRKQDTNLEPHEHVLVKPGDIAYNTMRMWQGAFGLSDKEGLVSPAYVVLKAKVGVDPLYAFYLLKSQRIRYLLWAYSHGMTEDRLRLYFDDFARIPVKIPDFQSQMKIGEILNTWDKAIAASERLESIEGAQTNGAVQSFLARSRLQVKQTRLGDCAEVLVSSVDKHSHPDEQAVQICNYTDVYYSRHLTDDYPFEQGTASQSEIERFTIRSNDVVITKDSEDPRDIGVAACITKAPKNLVCGYHLAIVRPKGDLIDGVLLQTIFSQNSTRKHLLAQANGATRFGLSVKAIESIQILLPTQSDQHVLRDFLLTAERRINLRRRITQKLKNEKISLEQHLLSQRA